MVSTDLMGKGIDISRVNLVVNYDFPINPRDYFHRIARSGRFETEGIAVTFIVNYGEEEVLNKLIKEY